MAAENDQAILPMKPSAGVLPTGPGWRFEMKWDGIRAIIFLGEANPARIQSSNGNLLTVAFEDLAPLAQLGEGFDDLVLDGEIVVFGDDNLPSFSALQPRIHQRDPARAAFAAAAAPAMYMIFDVLRINGESTMALGYDQRRGLLEKLVDTGPNWALCEQMPPEPDQIAAIIENIAATRLEGLVAKHGDSVYSPGTRTNRWIKIKPRGRQEFVVAGWLQGSNGSPLSSLILGVHASRRGTGPLVYAGRAGSGLNADDLEHWLSRLTPAVECPFDSPPELPKDRAVTWAVPERVVEVSFAEWPEGRQVRHPVVEGERVDKAAHDIIRE